ncbi:MULTISPECIES: ankyrin repeat domain-containing protein [Niastella]|uniref:Ankyrin repeat domain-containing protein n=1 Tax=Niastella soli TaxID=2821487 RepID=A0ABS3Z0G7_9BACT|nr:ankyrin repeat domain-containing protein [Niastella soli]MBO9203262.1 ankyrin repeat domain-containing protein [Niastella soli]
MKTSWGVAIFLDIEEMLDPDISKPDIKITDRIYLRISDTRKLSSDEITLWVGAALKGLAVEIYDKVNGVVCYDLKLLDFSYTDFQIEGLFCAVREWVVKYYDLKIEPIEVNYDKVTNKYIFELPGDPIMNKSMFIDYAEKNNVEKLRELLGAGMNINELAYDKSALHATCVTNASEAAAFLIENRIDVNLKDKQTGATALHYCAVYNHFEIANLIVANGGRLDIHDDYGNEPLWTAVFNVRGKIERLPLVELFLIHGGNKNHKNNAGRSPLDFLNQIKHIPLIELLNKY